MKIGLLLLIVFFVFGTVLRSARRCDAQSHALRAPPARLAADSALRRPVHTYSIVARDPKTGQMGVAVQSHYFSVGPIVPWAEAGVGAIATQSIVEVSYGPRGLDLMRNGKSAADALAELHERLRR